MRALERWLDEQMSDAESDDSTDSNGANSTAPGEKGP